MFEKYYQGEKPFFRTYAYAAPGYEQGDYIYGQPRKLGLATKENYEIYKATGFNMVFSGTVGTYYGEDWETSVCKKVMDEVYAAGIDKYIVGDQAFYELSCQADGIVGEGKRFATEQDLDAFVANRIKDYSKHPAFYGIYLKDEPHHYLFKSFGQLYRSIKRVCPTAFVYCNLLPLDTLRWMDERYPKGGDLLDRRTKYLEKFLDETGADYIMYDDYPFCFNKENKIYYILCLQNAASLCRDRGIEFNFVAQSTSMKIGGVDYYWKPSEQEMRYQMHLLLGFGVKDMGFFTYLPHGNNALGEGFENDSAMVTAQGERLQLYYDTQKVLAEIQDILPVVLRFTYRHSGYAVASFHSFLKQLDFAKNETLDNVTAFETDKEGVLVNELYNQANGDYLYRVINMTDTREEEMQGVAQTTKLHFKEGYTRADVFQDGKWTTVAMEDGELTIQLLAGDAAYILIY